MKREYLKLISFVLAAILSLNLPLNAVVSANMLGDTVLSAFTDVEATEIVNPFASNDDYQYVVDIDSDELLIIRAKKGDFFLGSVEWNKNTGKYSFTVSEISDASLLPIDSYCKSSSVALNKTTLLSAYNKNAAKTFDMELLLDDNNVISASLTDVETGAVYLTSNAYSDLKDILNTKSSAVAVAIVIPLLSLLADYIITALLAAGTGLLIGGIFYATVSSLTWAAPSNMEVYFKATLMQTASGYLDVFGYDNMNMIAAQAWVMSGGNVLAFDSYDSYALARSFTGFWRHDPPHYALPGYYAHFHPEGAGTICNSSHIWYSYLSPGTPGFD